MTLCESSWRRTGWKAVSPPEAAFRGLITMARSQAHDKPVLWCGDKGNKGASLPHLPKSKWDPDPFSHSCRTLTRAYVLWGGVPLTPYYCCFGHLATSVNTYLISKSWESNQKHYHHPPPPPQKEARVINLYDQSTKIVGRIWLELVPMAIKTPRGQVGLNCERRAVLLSPKWLTWGCGSCCDPGYGAKNIHHQLTFCTDPESRWRRILK